MSYPFPRQRNGAVFDFKTGVGAPGFEVFFKYRDKGMHFTRVVRSCDFGFVTLCICHLSCHQKFVVIFNNLSLTIFTGKYGLVI